MQNLILGDGLGNVLGEHVEQNLLPGLNAVDGGGFGGGELRGENDAPTCSGKVHGGGAEDEADGGDDFKVDERLKGNAADAAQMAVAGDTGGDGGKEQRGDDHANEAQEEIAEDTELRGDMRRVKAEFDAGGDGEEGPEEDGAGAQAGDGAEKDSGDAEDDADGCSAGCRGSNAAEPEQPGDGECDGRGTRDARARGGGDCGSHG